MIAIVILRSGLDPNLDFKTMYMPLKSINLFLYYSYPHFL